MKMNWLRGCAACVLILAACGGNSTQPKKGSIRINGSGSTFIQPLLEDLAYGYALVDPPAAINYSGGGSGQGKKDILAGTVLFAGSDAALSDAEAAQKPLAQFPLVAGAVVAIYNLPGVQALALDGNTLGNIYAGKIEKWNDAAIAALNPGVNLPDLVINVAHRSDGSGTTSIFTTYLCAANEAWKAAINPCKGTTVDWPVDKLKRGQGGSGNPGVAAAVQKTAGAIGYVELAYAKNNKIPYAQMVNAAGKKIDATIASTTAATSGAKFSDRNAADIVNSPNAEAWPIAGFTYLLLNKEYADCAKAGRLVSWINWMLTEAEPKDRMDALLYAPLGAETRALSVAALKGVTCNGQAVLK